MRRRDFIKIIPGLAAACPLLARAQQLKRHIGVVVGRLENDPVGQAELAALFDSLRQLGWTVDAGGNIQVDYRFPGTNIDQIRADVAEIVGTAARPNPRAWHSCQCLSSSRDPNNAGCFRECHQSYRQWPGRKSCASRPQHDGLFGL